MTNTSRFSGLIDVENIDSRYFVIGCGSVGTNAVHVLASTGVTDLSLCDGDDVGIENIPVSWFSPRYIGENKAFALAAQVRDTYGFSPSYVPRPYDDNVITSTEIAVVAPDSMSARKMIFSSIESGKLDAKILIDFRIGAAMGEMFIVDLAIKEQVDKYRLSLNNNADELQCGAKAYPGIVKGWVPMKVCAFVMRRSRGLSHPFWEYTDQTYNVNLATFVKSNETDSMPEEMTIA